MLTGPDSYRTTTSEIDFNISHNRRAKKTTSSVSQIHNLPKCQVVLEDVCSSSFAEKLRTLKFNPEKTHSVSSRQALDKHFLENLNKKDPIAWPKMNSNEEWEHLDGIVANKLFNSSSLTDRVNLLEETIYSQGALLFGFFPKTQKNLNGLNRRAKHCIQLITEKNTILCQLNNTSDISIKQKLFPLLENTKRKLRNHRRGETSRKRRWKIKKANEDFFRNPYEAGKNVLDPKCNINLQCTQSSLDTFKTQTLSDINYNVPLPPLEGLPPPPNVSVDFDSSSLKFDDFSQIINSRRNASSPGLNMIPYKVYKKCPRISSFLFKIFKSCIKVSKIPIQWRVASEVYIPKKKPPDSSTIEDFRPIALLNVEGKIFFSLLAKRLESHIIVKNKLINTSIQKGCISKVPGCWEHMSLVWNQLKSVTSNKGSLAAVWLDIANAYGSIPHQLIFLALERYGVDPLWINLVKAYYAGLWSKSFAKTASSSWHQHFRGIFTGYTLSIILFLSGMNVALEYITAGINIFNILPSSQVKAFMDDLFLMSPSVNSTQDLLNRASVVLSWARMSLKASKSKSLIFNNGKVAENESLFVLGENIKHYIPSISENPVKFLGRTICDAVSDKAQLEIFKAYLHKSLSLIDKSKHRSIHKLWILQHLLIPRLRWPLMIYEFSLTAVTKFEQTISVYIRKWLRLHNNTSNICLYSSSSPCPLPIKGLSSVLKSSKVSAQLLLRESSDPNVSNSNISLTAGKLNIPTLIKDAENRLDFKSILGYHQSHRAGFGSLSIPEVPPKCSHNYRKLLCSMVEELDEEKRQAKAVQLAVQGQWTRWCNFVRLDLSWKTILAMPQPLLSFALAATYDTLSSPSNLHRWRKITNPACLLCEKPICTSAHVLGACRISLTQGRYTYRHDSVLSTLYTSLNSFLSNYDTSEGRNEHSIKFVRAGSKVKKQPKKHHTGLLHLADDWKMLVDLDSKLVFPSFIAITSLRPDLVLYSLAKKTVIILELTCPCEENMEEWHRVKFEKYEPLATSIRSRGWIVHLFPVEIGARGYCSNSVKSCLSRLGLSSKSVRLSLKQLSLASLTASFQIWQAKDCLTWVTPPVLLGDSKPKSDNVKKPPCMPKRNKDPKCDKQIQSKNQIIRCGLLNKGNTCYVNATLQCLSSIVPLWSNLSLNNNKLTPLTASFIRIMSLLNSSKSTLDPSNFLRHLKIALIKSGKTNFDIYQQQDAAEILMFILNELASDSIHTEQLIFSKMRNEFTCHHCLQINLNEDSFSVFQVPLSNSIQTALNKTLCSEELSEDNPYYCNFCSEFRPASVEHSLSKVGRFLCIQLKRFINHGGNVIKDIQKVICNENISVPLVDGEITFYKQYRLIATINHTGNLDRGHYTSFIKSSGSNQWLFCNDAAVLNSTENSVNNTSSYIYFYEAV